MMCSIHVAVRSCNRFFADILRSAPDNITASYIYYTLPQLTLQHFSANIASLIASQQEGRQ